MDGPAKITARVAPFLDAIRQARSAGWGWREITDRVALGANPDAIRSAVKKCRYSVEQLPLPEPQTATLKNVRATVENATAKSESKQKSEPEAPRKPLQRIGESKTKDESEMSAQERLIASIPHI